MPTVTSANLNVDTIYELNKQQYPAFFDALNVYRSNIVFTLYNAGYYPIDAKLVNEDVYTHTHDSLYTYLVDKLDGAHLGSVLDIGCGRGRGIDTVRRYYSNDITFGCDKDAIAIELAKTDYPNINFHEADVYSLPYNNDVFDTVLNVNSSSFYGEDRAPFLQEVNRVLKAGGSFLFTDVFKTHEEAASIRAVFEQYFDVINVTDITSNALQSNDYNKSLILAKGDPYLVSINAHVKIALENNIIVCYSFICKSKK